MKEVEGLELSRSWTTRPRRSGEDQSAYTFVSRQEFRKAIDEGRFLEWAEFNENLYGTPIPMHMEDKDLLLEIDSQGAHSIRSLFSHALIVLILSPSEESLEDRMRSRGDDESHIQARLSLAAKEIAAAREIADFEVVNSDLDSAVREIASMIYKARESKF